MVALFYKLLSSIIAVRTLSQVRSQMKTPQQWWCFHWLREAQHLRAVCRDRKSGVCFASMQNDEERPASLWSDGDIKLVGDTPTRGFEVDKNNKIL